MKLHFEFKLATFRIEKTGWASVSHDGNLSITRTQLTGSSKELKRKLLLEIEGKEKNNALYQEIPYGGGCILLYSVNANITMFPGITIFAIAKNPYCNSSNTKDFNVEDLEYLVIHPGTQDMNEFVNLEKLDAYLYQWKRENFLFDVV